MQENKANWKLSVSIGGSREEKKLGFFKEEYGFKNPFCPWAYMSSNALNHYLMNRCVLVFCHVGRVSLLYTGSLIEQAKEKRRLCSS